MSLVVFMRGVNVGGHKTFQPSLLAKELVHLGVINVGAAGTFVIPGTVAETTLRAEFLGRLPFPAELMICRGRDLVKLAAKKPFPERPSHKDVRRFVSVMAKHPRQPPPLPLSQPPGDGWQVQVIGVSGRFALSLWRPMGRSSVDLNGVVERSFGVSATTRNWNTIVKICDILEGRRSAQRGAAGGGKGRPRWDDGSG